ncbi:transposase, partial [Streptococcus agalactiae]
FDCYLCPENQVLTYRTTTREGYREYKSNPKICKTCPLLAICTESRQYQKVVVRHIWKDALEVCEDIRHQSDMKELYQHRKETIERLFGTAKEYHNLRYTREKGKSKMEAKVGLTLACLNIKKLVKMMTGKTCYFTQISQYYWFMGEFGKNIKKTNIKNDVCLHSETLLLQGFYFVSLFIHCPYLRKKILGTDSNIELGHLISSLFVILIYRIY